MNTEYIDELLEKLVKFQSMRLGVLDDYSSDSEKPSLPLFHRVYPLSNEQLNQYFSKLNLNNKKVLTVGSSGDQILYSLLYGAKDITFVDINPYAKFYIDLKIAAIKHFDHKEFTQFFNFNLRSSNIIKSTLYMKISHLLPEDSRYFWDNIFLNFDKLEGFTHGMANIFDHYVYNENQFNAIKERLLNEDYNLTFYTMDIKDITDLMQNEKYDAIFLSNIYDYIDKWNGFTSYLFEDITNDYFSPQQKQFFSICQELLNSLNPNGILQVQYGFTNIQKLCNKAIFTEIFKDYCVYDIKTFEGGPIIIQNTPRENNLNM